MERTCADWCSLLLDARVPVAPVADREEWLESELVAANEMNVGLEDPDLGLVSMRERAAELGGQMDLRSRPGQGTEVVVIVPRT